MTDKADPCGSDSSAVLGPLPEPYTRQWINAPFTERLLFSEEQMRFYAAAEIVKAIRNERERCAKLCDAVAGNSKDHSDQFRRGAGRCAADIRA